MAKIYRVNESFEFNFFEGSSCAFGVFDGVHLGHQFLLACAKDSAQKNANKSIALTFSIDPDEMFHPQRLKKLMSNEDRIATLASTGVDAVVVLPFTKDFSALGPLEFLYKTFRGYLPESLHVGSDFRFGVKASGTVKELGVWSEEYGTTIFAHDLKNIDELPISSTRIRALLAQTNTEEANKLLGRPYYLNEKVEAGRGEGVDFGFRTANLKIPYQQQVLGEGVYAALVEFDGKQYKAAVSVGVSPTFQDEATATCEVHIIDFDRDVYGQKIKVSFLHFLRPMIKFESKDELIETVLANIKWVRENI